MKLTQLNRYTGLLATAAIGLFAAPDKITAQDGPESVITTPIKALKEKDPKLLWEMLPASYQSDINGVAQEFAKNMDAELWNAGVGLLKEVGALLDAQKELLAKMSAESDPNTNPEEAKQAMEVLAKVIKKFAESELGSLDKMKSIDLGKVADTFGKDILNLAEETAKLTGETDPFQLAALKAIKVEVVNQDGDNATIKVSGLPEVDLSGLQGGLPPGIPGLPGGLDGAPIPDFSTFENGEQKLTKVEGKWVPAEVVDDWKAGITEAKLGLSELGNIPALDKQMAVSMIGSLTKALGGMKTAKNEQEFQMAMLGAMGAAMAGATGAGGLEGFGGPGGAPPGFGGPGAVEVSPAQQAQARKLAEGQISLSNGDVIEGEISDVNADGIVVRVKVGGFSKRVNWMQLTQESLKKVRKLGRMDKQRYGVKTKSGWIGANHFVEPFIEPEEWQMEQSEYPEGVDSLPDTGAPKNAEVTSKLAAYGSPGGTGILVAVAIGSLVAGLGVASFKESNVALAGVISFVLPIIGPLLLLAKPKVEYEYEGDEDDDAYYDEEPEAPAGAVMGDTGGGAVAGMLPEAKKMSFAQSGPKKQTSTEAQSWDRDDTRFDRSFFQNNFPNYFKVVLGAAERNMALAIRTGKREYVGQRIKRISGADLHMELLSGKEQKISFSEIGSVDLRPK